MYANGTIRKIADSLADAAKKPGGSPPQWLLDRIADEKFNAGYKGAQRSRLNQCGICFELRSISGTCGCP
jgi:hypothetical protein